jgi:hypothetical protein
MLKYANTHYDQAGVNTTMATSNFKFRYFHYYFNTFDTDSHISLKYLYNLGDLGQYIYIYIYMKKVTTGLPRES